MITDAATRIEHALTASLANADSADGPPRLAAAMRYAVFPRGARIRPRLCLAVAGACGGDRQAVTDAVAASIELLHCASLVHDDLPCFDDALIRRGKPSVHKAFGEPLAVLAGDALIVLAFQNVARAAAYAPQRLPALIMILARSVGMPSGIIAGQAWESEPEVDLADYHRAKTGALFAAATIAGAVSAGAKPDPWRILGERLGESYQLADDIKDAVEYPEAIGKPVGRDQALGRPSGVAELGVSGAIRRLERLVDEAIDSIPACVGQSELRAHIFAESQRLVPKGLSQRVAA